MEQIVKLREEEATQFKQLVASLSKQLEKKPSSNKPKKFAEGKIKAVTSQSEIAVYTQSPSPSHVQDLYSHKKLYVTSFIAESARTMAWPLISTPNIKFGQIQVDEFLYDFLSQTMVLVTFSSIFYRSVRDVTITPPGTPLMLYERMLKSTKSQFHPTAPGTLVVLEGNSIIILNCIDNSILAQINISEMLNSKRYGLPGGTLVDFAFSNQCTTISFVKPYIFILSASGEMYALGPLLLPGMRLRSSLLHILRQDGFFNNFEAKDLVRDLYDCDTSNGNIIINPYINLVTKYRQEIYKLGNAVGKGTEGDRSIGLYPMVATFPTFLVTWELSAGIEIQIVGGQFIKPSSLKIQRVCFIDLSPNMSSISEIIPLQVKYMLMVRQVTKKQQKYWSIKMGSMQDHEKYLTTRGINEITKLFTFKDLSMNIEETIPGYLLCTKYDKATGRGQVAFKEIPEVLKKQIKASLRFRRLNDNQQYPGKGKAAIELKKRELMLKEKHRTIQEVMQQEEERIKQDSKRTQLLERAENNERLIQERLQRIMKKMPYFLRAKNSYPTYQQEEQEVDNLTETVFSIQDAILQCKYSMDLQEELNDEWRHNVPGFASEQDKESEKLSAEMMEIHEDIEKRYEMMGGN